MRPTPFLTSLFVTALTLNLCGCSSTEQKKAESQQPATMEQKQSKTQSGADDVNATFAHHPISFYLAHQQIPKVCKDVFLKNRSPMDNDIGINIADSITSTNKETAPFYFLAMTKMFKDADGAISEELGFMAKAYIENNALTFVKYFTEEPLLTTEDLNSWATSVAWEIQLSAEGDEEKEANRMMAKMEAACSNASPTQKKKLQEFLALMHSVLVISRKS